MVTVKDIRFTEAFEYRINGENYTFGEGDTVAFPVPRARKLVEAWDVAEYDGGAYEVDEYAIGASSSGASNGDDLDELGYRELQERAKEHDISANQSADDLRDALRDVDG